MAKRVFPQSPAARPIEDLTGQRTGHLLIMRPYRQRDERGKLCWICRCDCGIEVAYPATDLRRGIVRTCGSDKCPYRGK